MATFAYGRVSTNDQSSINQRLEIENTGIRIDYWYADEGVSGKTHASQRPQFKALLHQIRDGGTKPWWSPNWTVLDATPKM